MACGRRRPPSKSPARRPPSSPPPRLPLPTRRRIALALALLAAAPLGAQQVADSAFVPAIGAPRWPAGRGPRLVLDEAHHNFHTLAGRYLAFGRLAAADGFRVAAGRAPFTDASLRGVDVLVIANALAARNAGDDWRLPTPSAFTADEIAAVRRFVERGGGLLLVADHMPFAGAAEALGAALGVQFANGFAEDSAATAVPLVFRRGADDRRAALGAHAAILGSGAGAIDAVATFTGSAFRLTAPGVPLLRLPRTTRVWMPVQAWVFGDSVPKLAGPGWLQGAALAVGRGRVVVLGEAAMLSAQRAGAQRAPMGMNHPRAGENALFGARVLRWLGGAGS